MKAYRLLARKYHPDKNPNGDPEQFQAIKQGAIAQCFGLVCALGTELLLAGMDVYMQRTKCCPIPRSGGCTTTTALH